MSCVEDARGGVGVQPARDDQIPVALLEPCQLLAVPCIRRAAQQQLEGGRRQGLVEAARNLATQHRGVGETVSGLRPAAEPGLAFDGGRALG